MDSIVLIIQKVINICTSLTVLGIPILYWEFLILFINVVLRILFGVAGEHFSMYRTEKMQTSERYLSSKKRIRDAQRDYNRK